MGTSAWGRANMYLYPEKQSRETVRAYVETTAKWAMPGAHVCTSRDI